MAHSTPATPSWPDLRALERSLTDPVARRLDPADRETLGAALGGGLLIGGGRIVSAGRPIGRVETHGSVTLYRPGTTADLEHRVLEVDPGGAATAAFVRDGNGDLREVWLRLTEDHVIGLLPGGAEHPLWGPSDRVVELSAVGSPTTLTLAGAVRWGAVDAIPPVTLIIHEPGHEPRALQLTAVVRLGRASDNDIVLDDAEVSRVHGRVAPRHGTWVFQDLGSSNGSFLNGHPVTEAALGIGDELRLGGTRLMVGPGS